jgi:hypothetical protein
MRARRTLGVTAVVAVVFTVAACVPPKLDGVPPTPVCREEAGDRTPNVFEVKWTYPNPPTEPVSACLVPEGLQVDTWISLAEGSTIAALLCSSIGGVQYSPGGIKPGQVWLICVDTGLNRGAHADAGT